MNDTAHTNPGQVAVVGGSIAGLFAAVLLQRAGWQVSVFERSDGELASRGAGITTHDELYLAFAKAGVDLSAALGVESLARVVFDRTGKAVGHLPMRQIMTSWGMLYRFLREQCKGLDYHGGISVNAVMQDDDGAELVFNNGTRHRADYVIAADGIRSTLRTQLLPEATLVYAGYVAWRGLAHESDLAPDLRRALVDRMAFCLPPGEQMLGYMVAGPEDRLTVGERWYNWVWYRSAPAEGVLADLLTDAQGGSHPHGIPPPRLRDEHIERLKTSAQRLLCPQFEAVVAATPRPFLQPIWDVCAPRLVVGRVLLIGDAGCTLRPHIGIGVSKAADDAARLTAALGRPPADRDAALKDWEAERLRFAQAALRHSRRLGSYIGPSPANVEETRRAAYYCEPAQVMAPVAAANPHQYLELAAHV